MPPPDPLEDGGIAAFARRFRCGDLKSASVTRGFLDRIEAIDPRVGAFWHVDPEGAMAAAEAMDAARAVGLDLGPLMGVPVAIKDLIAVDGMPTTCGTRMSPAAFPAAEGTHVRTLRLCGCVILGKTATVELAFGTTGINRVLGTPRNPRDPEIFRICGGSSSGSGAAVAAGLTGFAIGTDTGGSVRIPAALCGVFGHKTTRGLIATDGVFPLSPTFDTIGPLARSAADAALIFSAITHREVPEFSVDALRLRRPSNHFFDDLEPGVADVVADALDRLDAAGASIAPISVPEAAERRWVYPAIVPAELISAIGTDRFKAGRHRMDELTAHRAEAGLSITAVTYIDAIKQKAALARQLRRRLPPGQTLATPTVPIVAPAAAEIEDVGRGLDTHDRLVRNVQPIGLFDQCAVSLPLDGAAQGVAMPVGLQLAAAGGQDSELLGVACAVERLLCGPAATHDDW